MATSVTISEFSLIPVDPAQPEGAGRMTIKFADGSGMSLPYHSYSSLKQNLISQYLPDREDKLAMVKIAEALSGAGTTADIKPVDIVTQHDYDPLTKRAK